MEDDILDSTLPVFQSYTELFDFHADDSIRHEFDDWLDDSGYPDDIARVELNGLLR